MRVIKITVITMFAYVCVAGCMKIEPVRFAAIGDTPYFDSDVELQLLSDSLQDMADNKIPFVVHIGDIFSGRVGCSSELYKRRADVFSRSPIPFLITIGDNEFSDCKDSGYAQKLFRMIILNSPPIDQIVKGTKVAFESVKVKRQRKMIENATWSHHNVQFIMLVLPDLPGNYPLSQHAINKILDANADFMHKYFAESRKKDRDAIVLLMHSNPLACSVAGCKKFSDALFNEIKHYGKPVLLVNGSDHSQEFIDGNYMDVHNLWHLRPGSEPEESWPEVMYYKNNNRFAVKWHVAPD